MQFNAELNHRLPLISNGRLRSSKPNFLYSLGRSFVKGFAITMLDMDIVWRASLPEGPKIFAANHPTTIDPFLLLVLTKEPMSILVAGGAFTIPLFGRYLRAAGHIPVIRGRGRFALAEAESRLRDGNNIGIFPEGALSAFNGEDQEPKTGMARLALATGSPIIPVGVQPQWDQVRFIPAKIDDEEAVGRIFLRGPYAVTVGGPIFLSGDSEAREAVLKKSAEVLSHIRELSSQSAKRIQGSSSGCRDLKPNTAQLVNAGGR